MELIIINWAGCMWVCAGAGEAERNSFFLRRVETDSWLSSSKLVTNVAQVVQWILICSHSSSNLFTLFFLSKWRICSINKLTYFREIIYNKLPSKHKNVAVNFLFKRQL